LAFSFTNILSLWNCNEFHQITAEFWQICAPFAKPRVQKKLLILVSRKGHEKMLVKSTLGIMFSFFLFFHIFVNLIRKVVITEAQKFNQKFKAYGLKLNFNFNNKKGARNFFPTPTKKTYSKLQNSYFATGYVTYPTS